MHDDSDIRPLEALAVDFCDEDPATWTTAARAVGRLAARDGQALLFLQRQLAEAPPAAGRDTHAYRTTRLRNDDAQPPMGNVHRFRHACCALASFLSQPGADRAPVADVVEAVVVAPLTHLCLQDLRDGGGTVGQLKTIPHLAEQFDDWRASQIAAKQKTVEKFADGSNPRALEANQKALAELEALTEQSPLPGGYRPAIAAAGGKNEWSLACYLAGVRTTEGLLGFDPALLVGALLRAASRSSGGLPYVLSVPDLLARLADELPAKTQRAMAKVLVENVNDQWAELPQLFNEYVLALTALPGAPAFMDLWAEHVDLPGWLADDLEALAAVAADADGARDAGRLGCRLIRDIAEKYFGDDWRWKEHTDAERFSLNVYVLLMAHGPGALLAGGKDADPNVIERCLPALEHRISLLLEAIQTCLRARGTILPSLVRGLKDLLCCELADFDRAVATKGRLADAAVVTDELMKLCHRQMLIVKPLMADWLLPSTLRKDLAVVVCRILHKAYRTQLACRERLAAASDAREVTVDLLYVMLYAFPDNLLLREMVEHSSDDHLCRLLDCARQLIEQFEDVDAAATAGAGGQGFAQAAEASLKRYEDFAVLLLRVSVHGDTPGGWLDGLSEMVRHVARIRSDRRRPVRDPERPLQPILLYGQKSRQDWRALVDAARGQREDRTGADDERSERQSAEYLAARTTAGEFRNLLDDIEVLEGDTLPEVGQPHMDSEIVHRWRRLINQLAVLSRLCSEQLPGLERKLCSMLIDHRVRCELEPRLERIVDVVEQEREADAVTALAQHVERTRSEGEDAASEAQPDAHLIQDWMLRRYMIRDLAQVYGLRFLQWLTSWRFVVLWVAVPFAACAILHQAGARAWRGIPFALTGIANVVLIVAFALETHRRLPKVGSVRISPWRFLLPQTTAAIFLAIFSSIPSDERWSLTIKANLPVQVVTWVLFLVVGFVFLREIILADQFRGRPGRREKNRRAGELMALSLWQAFAIVMFFSITVGRIMAAEDRGSIELDEIIGLSKWVSNLIPTEVYLGSWFLEPADGRAAAAFWVFPRAIVSWTIQMFFFGAIFERIMGRSES